jgi:hypothetical protein
MSVSNCTNVSIVTLVTDSAQSYRAIIIQSDGVWFEYITPNGGFGEDEEQVSILKWLDAYYMERKFDMGDIEWQFDRFARYIIDKGLGYPSRLVRKEKNRTDIRILTGEAISGDEA